MSLARGADSGAGGREKRPVTLQFGKEEEGEHGQSTVGPSQTRLPVTPPLPAG